MFSVHKKRDTKEMVKGMINKIKLETFTYQYINFLCSMTDRLTDQVI